MPWDVKSASLEQFVPPVDSPAQGVVGFVDGQSFRDFDGRSPFQRYQFFTD